MAETSFQAFSVFEYGGQVLQNGAGLTFNIPSYLVMHMQTVAALLDCRLKREDSEKMEPKNEVEALNTPTQMVRTMGTM